MVSAKLLSEGKTAVSLKRNGNIDDLKLFVNEIVQVDESHWTRNGGHNGEPFVFKLGEDIIRWFPTTKTLQVQGRESESLKRKLLLSIASVNDDAGK